MRRRVPALADSLLDFTVLGSYTSIGYGLRSRGWRVGDLPRMEGQVVAVTGATSGIGMAAAAAFARLGAAVWLVARNAGRAERAREKISQETGSSELHVGVCDLSELASVRRFALELTERAHRLDVLVHNAGVMAQERTETGDGIELTVATNVVGPHLLTRSVLALLRAAPSARIIAVSSGGMYTQRLDPSLLIGTDGEFSGPAVYAQTKRMEVVLSELWARELAGSSVVSNAMHPGWVDTPGLSESLPTFHRVWRRVLRTPEQGADTIVWLGCAPLPGDVSGGFWFDRARRPTHRLPWTRESAAQREELWVGVEQLSRRGLV